jgi:hypothetical protein
LTTIYGRLTEEGFLVVYTSETVVIFKPVNFEV